MTDSQNLHLLYKNLGETPHETIVRFKKEHPEYAEISMTYAGRLDPMAEGLLLVLSGDGVMEKEAYLDLPKSYEFEVLWGVSTDTLDLLGFVTGENNTVPSEKDVEEYVTKSLGKFEQLYPVYSSRPIEGKSLFQWAREGRLSEIDIPKHEVEILSAKYISRKVISKNDLLKDVISKVGLVKGDFRQEETVEIWKKMLDSSSIREFSVDTFSLEVSSGFYVRQFVSDLAQHFQTAGVTFHIQRTRIGEFHL